MENEVLKQGQSSVTASVGTKRDSEANAPGSQADPQIKRESLGEVRRFVDTNYSKVGVTVGLTRSLGNYEFARIDCYMEDFCAPDRRTETFESLREEASKLVSEVSVDIDNFISSKKQTKNNQGF